MGDTYYLDGRIPEAVEFYEPAFNLTGHDQDVVARRNLARSLQYPNEGDNNAQIERAIELHRGTLELQTAGSPEWAVTQMYLGTAWDALIKGDLDDNAGKALEALDAAVGGLDKVRNPYEWALAQLGRAQALRHLQSDDRHASVAQGAGCQRGSRRALSLF